MSEFAAPAFDWPSPAGTGWQGETWRGWVRFGKAGNLRTLSVEESYPFSQSLLLGRGFGRTLLESPLGTLAGMTVLGSPLFSTWIPPDFQNPIATATISGLVFLRFPDVTGDGFDEVLRQHEYGPTVIGCTTLLDGATMNELWRHYDYEVTGLTKYYPTSVIPWPDLNGDHSPDVISCWARWWGNNINPVVLALDGLSGQVIWRYEDPHSPAVFPVADCPDIDGDSVTDIVLGMHGTVQRVVMLSGASGIPVWTADIAGMMAPYALSGHRFESFDLTLVPSVVPRNSGEVDILMEAMFDPFWFVLPTQYRFFHLDARTGALRGFVKKPIVQSPWLPDPFDMLGGVLERTRIGDWDRDGLAECVAFTNGVSLDLPNNSVPPRHLAILGLKTLLVPSERAIGASFEAEVTIPSAPGQDFTLLLSQGFDRAGGQVIDGWRTFLTLDALMLRTRTGMFSSTLDQDGNGSVTVTLPHKPSLSGATIYSKAVIWKPGSTGEVWTMSSLGITEVR